MISAQTETGAFSRYAVPDTIHFCATLPKTSVGKVDKKVLRNTATVAVTEENA
jgi:fatty-acyl-CoA synthase